MRMYGYLKEPYKTNKKDTIYKVMLHEKKERRKQYRITGHAMNALVVINVWFALSNCLAERPVRVAVAEIKFVRVAEFPVTDHTAPQKQRNEKKDEKM